MIAEASRKKHPLYDVILSHSPADSGLAALVSRLFEEAGLGVFGLDSFDPGEQWVRTWRESLVNSSAVVILLTRNSIASPHLAFEVGAAIMWNKPVFTVHEGVGSSEVPRFLSDRETYRLDQIPELVDRISTLDTPFETADREALASLYRETAIPADALLASQRSLSDFTERFNERQSRQLPVERVAQELVRMRKLGRLPRLKKT